MCSTAATCRVGEAMARVIYRCKSKVCKHVWAFDYPETREIYLGYGRKERRAYRLNEYGRNVDVCCDSTCPKCGNIGGNTAARVRGFKTEHVCDVRCTSAKGHNCECSCGGANHGKDWI